MHQPGHQRPERPAGSVHDELRPQRLHPHKGSAIPQIWIAGPQWHWHACPLPEAARDRPLTEQLQALMDLRTPEAARRLKGRDGMACFSGEF